MSAPLALSLMASLAAAVTSTAVTRITYPQHQPDVAMVEMAATAVCGNQAKWTKSARAEGGILIVTFTLHGSRCASGEQPRDLTYTAALNLRGELSRLGLAPGNATLKVETAQSIR